MVRCMDLCAAHDAHYCGNEKTADGEQVGATRAREEVAVAIKGQQEGPLQR